MIDLHPTTVPCPHWCTEPHGHGYPIENPNGTVVRFHETTFDTNDRRSGATITALELAADTHGPADVADPYISIHAHGDMPDAELTADEARALAECLLAAADRLDTIGHHR